MLIKKSKFGSYLKELRLVAGLSLRGAERASEGKVSNPYISQIESGKIENPSPHILKKLADIYHVPYNEIMEEAGYLKRSKSARSGIAFSLGKKLTPEERTELIKYLEFLRSRKGGKRQ